MQTGDVINLGLAIVTLDLFKFCDLGAFQKGEGGNAIFDFSTAHRSLPVGEGISPHAIGQGKYRFELHLGGGRKPPIKRWMMKFDKWYDNQKDMVNSIIIEEAL